MSKVLIPSMLSVSLIVASPHDGEGLDACVKHQAMASTTTQRGVREQSYSAPCLAATLIFMSIPRQANSPRRSTREPRVCG